MRGKFLVDTAKTLDKLSYKVIQGIEGCQCIVVKTLNPDYYLLFNGLKLIITETGSPLSHLAIVAREHKIPIFQVESIKNIPAKGTLSIHQNEIKIH